MKFRRLMALVLCFMVVLNAISFHAAANDEHRFQEFRVQSLMGEAVSVHVEKSMLKEDRLIVDGWLYTEEQWIDFFVRNLLVGENADKITDVLLSRSTPVGKYYRRLLCPPILPGKSRFWAYLSENSLAIVSHDISSTLCDRWHLNETGLTLFGR